MKNQIDELSDVDMEALDCDILKYWNNLYKYDNEIRTLGQVILSVPVSHITWKQMTYMYRNLKDSRLECVDVKLVDLNFDLLKFSNSKLWSNLTKK